MTIGREEPPISSYSVAEAKNRLPALLAAVERGEQVTITRRGKPVAELHPAAAPPPKRVTPEAVAWLERELAHIPMMEVDGATLVRAMRDEDDDG